MNVWKAKLEKKEKENKENMKEFKAKIEEEYSRLIETIQIQFDQLKGNIIIKKYFLIEKKMISLL